ncbi:MAG: hypothetical protein ACKVP7_25080 [Hyphomicrobiaceae bacterium]
MKVTNFLATAFAVMLASSAALAQAPTPSQVPGAPKASDAAAEAKFTASDKDRSGFLDGAELDPMKADLAKIDSNRDGRVSKEEYLAAVKAGLIK